jgi:hypothetical protein
MITDEKDSVQARVMPLEITWRNPLTLVRAHLRVKERSTPTTDGRSKPEGFAHVARIGTLIIAGQREYCELSKIPSFSLAGG